MHKVRSHDSHSVPHHKASDGDAIMQNMHEKMHAGTSLAGSLGRTPSNSARHGAEGAEPSPEANRGNKHRDAKSHVPIV